MGVISTKEQLFGAFRRRIKKYTVERLGEDVYLKPLSASVRALLADAFQGMDGQPVSITAKALQWQTVASGLVTAEGERIFTDDDLDSIGQIDADVIDEISQEILRMSGLGDEATGLEEAVKNSEGAPSADSPSSSGAPTGSSTQTG
jgi:hypothetical protein